MATLDLSAVDIRYVLNELRPNAKYGWRGSGGSFGHQIDVVIWRETGRTMPSELAILTFWQQNSPPTSAPTNDEVIALIMSDVAILKAQVASLLR